VEYREEIGRKSTLLFFSGEEVYHLDLLHQGNRIIRAMQEPRENWRGR